METSKLMGLFSAYDDPIQRIILAVLAFEQANITKDQPHFKSEVDSIVTTVTNTLLAKPTSE